MSEQHRLAVFAVVCAEAVDAGVEDAADGVQDLVGRDLLHVERGHDEEVDGFAGAVGRRGAGDVAEREYVFRQTDASFLGLAGDPGAYGIPVGHDLVLAGVVPVREGSGV